MWTTKFYRSEGGGDWDNCIDNEVLIVCNIYLLHHFSLFKLLNDLQHWGDSCWCKSHINNSSKKFDGRFSDKVSKERSC